MSGMEINGKKGKPIHYENIKTVAAQISNFFADFNKFSRYRVFGIFENPLAWDHKNTFFTGSFELMLEIFHDRFGDMIEDNMIVGDVDVILPKHYKDMFEHYLNINPIPFRKNGAQISFLHPIKGDDVQVDCNFKEWNFAENRPTEFAKFSTSYNLIDYSFEIKARFHKILLSSLTAAFDEKLCFSVQNGLRMRTNERESTQNLEDIASLLFLDKHLEVQRLVDFHRDMTNKEEQDFEKYIYKLRTILMEMDNFVGVLNSIKSFFSEEQTKKVMEKFESKVNEKEYEPEQLETVKKLVKERLNYDLNFSRIRTV